MTSQDMILRVRQSTRQIDSYVRGALLVEEILLQLNIAQNQLQYLKYDNGKKNPKDLVDIRTTRETSIIAPVAPKITPILNASEFLFPVDFRFVNPSRAIYSSGSIKQIDVLPEEACEQFIRTESNIPVLRTLKGFVKDDRLIVLSDPFDNPIENIELNYYRKLSEITDVVDCELPEHVHDLVCEIAVNRIVGRTNPQEYQISSDILNKTE